MPDTTVTPSDVLKEKEPLVLFAYFEPVGGLDRFQPAGFPEVGHVIYKAPRENGAIENVCIVDSPASMANHLEMLCMRGAHDFELVEELEGMPYLRCVTGDLNKEGKLLPEKREIVVTSLTEGHRIASTYFLAGRTLDGDGKLAEAGVDSIKPKKGKANASGSGKFEDKLVKEFGIELPGSSKAHPPADKWWDVFRTIFRYDPNALVHGVLFPQWQIKIPRVLTAHLEAFGASRVDRSGVKFDRIGQTTSGQPIFAVDDTTAREIRATFILDTALVQSFGRPQTPLQKGPTATEASKGPTEPTNEDASKQQSENQSQKQNVLGLTDKQKEFLVALALWKIKKLCETPFRFRSGCYLKCIKLANEQGKEVTIDVNIKNAIDQAGFQEPRVTDIFWPKGELYRAGQEEEKETTEADGEAIGSEDEEGE
jgi:CRISPR-associated protein Csb1